ncbi:MAG: hypothetical protein HY725_00600, partial [Candidatus Rokubacteria bacterium]|nr:hypothetical protein [Candidatus Rokubacteria bacterium]
VNFAHEASHALFGAGHGGPTDASRLAYSVFHEARGWISRPTATLLSRSYY